MRSLELKRKQKRIDQLRQKICEHDRRYYVDDHPLISDAEYDRLMATLLALEEQHPELITPDSPSQRVGGKVLEAFTKASHRTPMLSLQNVFSAEELQAFDTRVKKQLKTEAIEYLCEPKYDGLALNLVYEEGLLTQAITRGDGRVGELVTENIKTIKSIPLRLEPRQKQPSLPNFIELRGEVLMYKKDFQALNAQKTKQGLNAFANPRNAAAGAIRQLDSKLAAQRPLHFFCYALGHYSAAGSLKTGSNKTPPLLLTKQSEFTNYIQQLGLPVAKHTRLCRSLDEVIEFYNHIKTQRPQLPYEVDGVVIKVNHFNHQQRLGAVARAPRWAVAFKFESLQAQTRIKNIVVQVGRTGALTPVAIMDPVQVGGVCVQHATLHNQQEIDRKQINIGSKVVVQRAGDVIPEVVKRLGPAPEKNFQMPRHCPTCGHKAYRDKDEAVSRCLNRSCTAILKQSIKHFVSRRAMNIEHMGSQWVEQLVEAGLLQCFSDLYKLKTSNLLKLERMGKKSAQNLITSIEKSKHLSLERFIYALGLRFVGEQTARTLARHFKSFEKLLKATESELLSLPDVGPTVVRSLQQSFNNKNLVQDIKALLQVLQLASPRSTGQKLALKTFVITGTLPVPREEVKNFIQNHGGKVTSQISSRVHYLVVGDNPGSKFTKAQKLQVPTCNWQELQAMI